MKFYFSNRFFLLLAANIVLFLACWWFNINATIPIGIFSVIIIALVFDACIIFHKKSILSFTRTLPERFSNGDNNTVRLDITNNSQLNLSVDLIEELPEQFQQRNNLTSINLKARKTVFVEYTLTPTERGEYHFGNSILYLSTPIKLVQRKLVFKNETLVKVYPSFINLKQYQLNTRRSYLQEAGTSVMRRIGNSNEFEHIKDYILGDDIRKINWKATAKKSNLMVNHYVDEKSQQIFCIIDKGRLMKMPFNGMSLLDYAINASLGLCSVCLNKQDKFGLVTFSNTISTFVQASSKKEQLNNVLNILYNQNSEFQESNFESLYINVRTQIKQRSLLVLYTNFESLTGMRRQLPFLTQLAKHHLLMVVFFENTELVDLSNNNVSDLESVYNKTVAAKFVLEKRMIVKELAKYGILGVLCAPEELTVNSINKYLEIKYKQAL
ncbi:DUF58 domain-containing protein [Polluticaenibacter yanchengensis]|uniref:DUF58 domain-containing protein n=1 Tax=Polluticaenibacter yanchengensis TaxID=3014562 RepID=A0ABT4UMH5_9BACT|nr:DUF58 domain-containing protein [Chitinophagaceae bacterium LY-5]